LGLKRIAAYPPSIDCKQWSDILSTQENKLRRDLRNLQEKHAEEFDRSEGNFQCLSQDTQTMVASMEPQQDESHQMDYLPADTLRN